MRGVDCLGKGSGHYYWEAIMDGSKDGKKKTDSL